MLKKIISGGQSGVERAALDAAVQTGVSHGGWMPKGRQSEDGLLPEAYQLQELPSDDIVEALEKNVIEADGTLIISRGTPAGTADQARQLALRHGKQLLHLDLNLNRDALNGASLIKSWLALNRIETLNVVGSQTNEDPAIYVDALAIITLVA